MDARLLPRERPILFSAPMVRAILAGRKTQTRRLYKPRSPSPYEIIDETPAGEAWPFVSDEYGDYHFRPSPYGVVGDRLWVRETHLRGDEPGGTVWYRATEPERVHGSVRWTPSIYMPRWASRITLEITAVRVQRLQAISGDDARAEGLSSEPMQGKVNGEPAQIAIFDPVKWFQVLWDGINGKRAPWTSNPWVWALTFRRIAS